MGDLGLLLIADARREGTHLRIGEITQDGVDHDERLGVVNDHLAQEPGVLR